MAAVLTDKERLLILASHILVDVPNTTTLPTPDMERVVELRWHYYQDSKEGWNSER